MVFDIQKPKISNAARYIILTTVFAFVIVLLVNTGISHSVRNKGITESDTTLPQNEKVLEEYSSKINLLAKIQKAPKNTDKDNYDDLKLCFDSHQEISKNIHHDSQAFKLEDSENSHSMFYMMANFSEVLSYLNIKMFVIEPKTLYCMLEKKDQELLRKRNFNVSSSLGSKNIMTLGTFETAASSLQKEDNVHKFRIAGFQPYFVTLPLLPWMQKNESNVTKLNFTSHIFFFHYELTIHIVVFYQRSSYLWHATLESDDKLNIPPKKDLLFADYNSAYENFSLEPVASKNVNLSNIFIPSNPQYFLFQIPSSRFLECNLTRAINIKISASDSSLEKFKKKTVIALDEMKTLFSRLLMHFWIFSGTMLGWYRQCGLIPYTSDVDFGVWASEVDDLDYLIKYFQNNTKLYIRERMGMLEEALEFQLRCDGLRVDVFFMYKINNGSWASGHRPSKGYYFRYHYPHFNLCSAELLEQKVQVPCETEDVIKTEYGPKWMKPVSSWNYESSIHNRGPNIYWDEKRRQKAFKEF